jgi:hypothetical protein
MNARSFVAGSAAALAALAFHASTAAAVDLTGATTITATGSGVTDIEVTAPAQFSTAIDANPTISMQGDALAYGFVLEQSTPTSLGPYIAAFKVRPGTGCDGPCGDAFGAYLDTYTSIEGSGQEVTLPAGRYRLGVLAPDGPVTIVLRPAGVSGQSTVSSLVPTPAIAQVLPRLDDATVPNTTRHGAAAALATRGIMYYSQSAHYGTGKVASERQFCDYEGEPTDSQAYGVNCPGGGGTLRFGPGLASTGPMTEYMSGVVRVAKPGTYGLGGNVTSVSGNLTVGAVAAWLPLYPAAAPPRNPDPPVTPPSPDGGSPASPVKSVQGASPPVQPQRLVVGRAKRRGGQVTLPLRCEATRRCSGVAKVGRLTRRFRVAAGKPLTLRLRSRGGTRVDVRWKVEDGPSGRASRRLGARR